MRFHLPGNLGLILLLYLAGLFVAPPSAQETLPPRLQIGINLLPAVIAANNSLSSIEQDKKLPIYLVYRDNAHLAGMLQANLGRIGRIRKRLIEIIPISLDELLELDPDPYSAIFISEQARTRNPLDAITTAS